MFVTRVSRYILFILLLAAVLLSAAGPGFRTERHLDDHYRKHGAEFGNISKTEYLKLAQQLRDTAVGDAVLQAKRKDGVVTRFHRGHGYFGAYDPDGTIRTFFKPAAGESYFWRQARR